MQNVALELEILVAAHSRHFSPLVVNSQLLRAQLKTLARGSSQCLQELLSTSHLLSLTFQIQVKRLCCCVYVALKT